MPSPAEPLSGIAAYYRGRRLAREAAALRPAQAPVPPARPERERPAEEIIDLRASQPEAGPVPLYGEHAAGDWPGPDPVVFGSVPRVKGWNFL